MARIEKAFSAFRRHSSLEVLRRGAQAPPPPYPSPLIASSPAASSSASVFPSSCLGGLTFQEVLARARALSSVSALAAASSSARCASASSLLFCLPSPRSLYAATGAASASAFASKHASSPPCAPARRARRAFASTPASEVRDSLCMLRNIGISAHIDSGKTTLTERILFYTGRIAAIHEVRGTDGVGAKMDSMELEREKGITIQSAATYCSWELKDPSAATARAAAPKAKGAPAPAPKSDQTYSINIIDTPGHVDFTIEVERALRVLDGAILVCCGVAGVQSQTLTVDRQMKRYSVPRLIFVNKLDRDGADPQRALVALRRKLGISTCPLQLPIGLEGRHRGVVDIIRRQALYFDGAFGEQVRVESEIPADLQAPLEAARSELLETLADLDDTFAEIYLEEGDEKCTEKQIDEAIRRVTIQRRFVPLLMGSAKGNKGIQPLLDAVCRYLPAPNEIPQVAYDQDKQEEEVPLVADPKKSLVALAFKIQELPVGQLTYLRLYQGRLRKGDSVVNVTTQKKSSPIKRILQMHADEAREVQQAVAGDIVAVSGLECNSGTTFTSDAASRLSLSSMFVPDPVVSLSVKVPKKDDQQRFAKALNRFQREDPTFRMTVDEESKETLISGMGELHLQIYLERMSREYRLSVETGEPKVNFRETVTQKTAFEYTHKKQSGGAGQYGKVEGYFEPITTDSEEIDANSPIEFRSELVGNDIPPNFIPSIEKGFRETAKKGFLSGHPIINMRVVLKGGKAHDVDSSDIAFRLAAAGALREFYEAACPIVLEPIMSVQVSVPAEFLAAGLGTISRRKGTVTNTTRQGDTVLLEAEVPLKNMFGYITDLRSCTQGQGAFTMDFDRYQPMLSTEQDELRASYQAQLQKGGK
ncbi:putative elongation factor EF-G [Besnoitia besnoiti]|uniref:Elongation factor G, mitochondrial n=1 Tax=Besnoitia besnoiti TaxID=94643 RepID=A0A2A9ML70_BESBE|nr:putative elongation factor EF-G [Besnoitia besnoiti]PFH37994.1 putative elongation factor EF-G [Besnoitia besnoiti]